METGKILFNPFAFVLDLCTMALVDETRRLARDIKVATSTAGLDDARDPR